MENNIFIFGANIFLTGREHRHKANKICFISIGAIFNFIWIMQDDTFKKLVCLLCYYSIADRPVWTNGPSTVQGRGEFHKQSNSVWKLEVNCRPSVVCDERSALQNSKSVFFFRSSMLGPWLADCPTVGGGPSARRPRVTGEVARGTSSNSFECGLFLWVSKDMGNSTWLVDLTCMESLKL
jgi:hypothetical protein